MYYSSPFFLLLSDANPLSVRPIVKSRPPQGAEGEREREREAKVQAKGKGTALETQDADEEREGRGKSY